MGVLISFLLWPSMLLIPYQDFDVVYQCRITRYQKNKENKTVGSKVKYEKYIVYILYFSVCCDMDAPGSEIKNYIYFLYIS